MQSQNDGAIAQLVEQRTENPCVPGSIPGGTTQKSLAEMQGFFGLMLLGKNFFRLNGKNSFPRNFVHKIVFSSTNFNATKKLCAANPTFKHKLSTPSSTLCTKMPFRAQTASAPAARSALQSSPPRSPVRSAPQPSPPRSAKALQSPRTAIARS